MAGIRAVMVTTPALLAGLIKQLLMNWVELDVVAEYTGRHALSRRLAAIRPDLVIIGLRSNESTDVVRELLLQRPATKFIALSGDGRSTLGFELRLYQTDLSDASPDLLAEYISSCAANFGAQIPRVGRV